MATALAEIIGETEIAPSFGFVLFSIDILQGLIYNVQLVQGLIWCMSQAGQTTVVSE